MPEGKSIRTTIDSAFNSFSSYAKVAVLLGTALISASIAYLKIFDNERVIAIEKQERVEADNLLREHFKEQLDVYSQRANKRYKRGMDFGKELQYELKELEERLRKSEIELSKIKCNE